MGQENLNQSNVLPLPQSLGASYNPGKIGIALVPFTPVPFSGQSGIYAWGRLLGYSALAVLTFKKFKTVSYIAMGAAATSLVTSLAANSWGQ